MSSRIPNRVITGLVPVISTGKAQRSLDRDGRVKPGHDNVRVAQPLRELGLLLLKSPVEPGGQRVEVAASTVAPHQTRRPGGASR